MARKYLLIAVVLIVALMTVSCGSKDNFSTANVKKYVQKMKKKQTYSDSKTRKALKSIFPKMKVD